MRHILPKYRLLIVFFLISLGVLSRTVWHLGDNVEAVTASALVSGAYLGLGYSLLVPFLIMAISDLIIGNTNIFLFTWSAYLIIGGVGYYCQREKSQKKTKAVLRTFGLGLGAGVWFFLWTNFGVWLLDSWGMYPKTLTGLVNAYLMGLPFLKMNLLGHLFLVPLYFGTMELVKYVLEKVFIKTTADC